MKARFITLTALALALLATACTEDATAPSRPGDATARSGAGPGTPARALLEESATLADRQTVSVNGEQYDFERYRNSDGSVTETRILKSGLPFVTLAGDIARLDEYASVSLTAYDEGLAVFNEEVLLQAVQGLPGPRRAMSLDLPCQEELALFGVATLALSYELMRRRLGMSSTRRLTVATGAVISAGYTLWQCLRQADRMPQP